jgi:hypothetical protein
MSEINKLRVSIQYFELIGCWGMAENLRRILAVMILELSESQQ